MADDTEGKGGFQLSGAPLGVGFLMRFTPFTRFLSYRMNWLWSNKRPPISMLVQLRRRERISHERYIRAMRFLGFNREKANNIFDVTREFLGGSELLTLKRRGKIDNDTYLEHMTRLGWSETDAKRLDTATESLLNPQRLLTLKWRENIEDKEFFDRMKGLGFPKGRAEDFEKSQLFYPSPRDLVTWQAKEVFEPDAIEKYGLEDEFDRLELDAFKKAGLTEAQVKNFWKAHWEHPSLRRIQEMLYRGLLTEDDVSEWFRLVEIPPYWREKFIKSLYRPLTRVDIRRMYDMGVLSEDEVYDAYRVHGYNKENANRMTAFTKQFYVQDERDLTRTQIFKAWEIDELTDDEVVSYLQGLGYSETEATLLLHIEKTQNETERIESTIDMLKDRFIAGEIDLETVNTEINALGLSQSYAEKVTTRFKREKKAHRSLPTKAELRKWTEKDIMTPKEFETALIKKNVPERFAVNHVVSLLLEVKTRKAQRWIDNDTVSERAVTKFNEVK